MIYIRTIVYIIFFGLYFMLGCQYGKSTANASKLEFNPIDPNLDLYYDRDQGRGDSNYE